MMDFEKAVALTGKDRVDEIESRLADYDDIDLRSLYSQATSYDSSFEDVEVFSCDELNDILCGMSPYDIVRAVHFGNVQNVRDWFYFNRYGNLATKSDMEYARELTDYIPDLAEWIVDHPTQLDSLYGEEERLLDAWDSLDRGFSTLEDYQ